MKIKETQSHFGVLCLKKTILPLLEEISSLLKIAFGPQGDAVMIQQKSPKELKITKCGLDIVNTFKGSRHPVLDLVIGILQDFTKRNGADGTKRIMFMLYFFLRALVHNANSNPYNNEVSNSAWRCQMVRQISNFTKHLSLNIFTTESNAQSTHNSQTSVAENDVSQHTVLFHLPNGYHHKPIKGSVWKAIESIARSFFRCRFPIKVSRVLEGLLVAYLKSKLHLEDNTRSNHFINGDEEIESRKNLSDSTNQNICHGSIKSDLQAAAKEFFNNSIEVANQLVENSKLVDGFLLSECASVKPYMAAYSGSGKDVAKEKSICSRSRGTRFLVWVGIKNDESSEGCDIFYNGSTCNSLNKGKSLLEVRNRSFERFISKCVDEPLGVDLVICNFGLPEFARHHCRAHKVFVIQYADVEEMHSLTTQANIFPVTGSFDSVCSEVDEASFARHHVGKTAEGLSIQEVCIARKFFTRIPLRNCENKHPLICGLTRQQTKQYSCALLNCIYLIASSFDDYYGTYSKAKCFDGKLESNESLSCRGTVHLVPISKTFRNTTERSFPYFEHTLISWIERHKTILLGTEEVSFAIQKSLQEIYFIQADGNAQIMADMAKRRDRSQYLSTIEETFDISSSETSVPNCYTYFPLANLLAQLECVLQMSQCILRIERVCSVAKHPSKTTK